MLTNFIPSLSTTVMIYTVVDYNISRCSSANYSHINWRANKQRSDDSWENSNSMSRTVNMTENYHSGLQAMFNSHQWNHIPSLWMGVKIDTYVWVDEIIEVPYQSSDLALYFSLWEGGLIIVFFNLYCRLLVDTSHTKNEESQISWFIRYLNKCKL